MEDEEENRKSILKIREDISNIKDLLTVIIEALENSQLVDIKPIIVNVLYFQLANQITQIDEELKALWNQLE